jgi:3-oxoacyl-[acyl-carrier protein] reductase
MLWDAFSVRRQAVQTEQKSDMGREPIVGDSSQAARLVRTAWGFGVSWPHWKTAPHCGKMGQSRNLVQHRESPAMPDDITGKIALVTGGSRGIGRAIAVALAGTGADVAVNYRIREKEARETCGEIEKLGRRAVAVQADVSVAADVARLVGTVEAKLGPVAILVNNAGVTRPQPIAEITEQDWDAIIAVNLKSVFLVTQAVLPRMRATGWGRIINLSSVAAQLGGVVGPHYAASKAGILGLTHSYAHLLAKEGITVNAIAPALIETEMVTGNPNARPALIPVGRFGTVEETADVAVMLARNGYITGQTINVNGGWYMS